MTYQNTVGRVDNQASTQTQVRTYSFDVFNKSIGDKLGAPNTNSSAKTKEKAHKSVSADLKKRKSSSRVVKNSKTAAGTVSRRGTRNPEQVKRQSKTAVGAKASQTAVAARNTDVKIHTVSAVKTIPFPTAIIFMTIIATLLFMFMLVSYVRINEYTIELEQLERSKNTLVSQVKELTLELEKKNNLKTIEEYATNVLGMVKIDQLTKKYITVDVEDKIEVLEEDDTIGARLSDFFDSVRRNFKDLLKYVG